MKWKKQVASLCLMLAMTVGMSAVSYAQFPFHLMIGSAAPVTLSEQQGYQLALEQAVVKHTSRTTSLLSLPQNEALEQQEQPHFYPGDTLYIPLQEAGGQEFYTEKSCPSNWEFVASGFDPRAVEEVRWANENDALTIAIDFASVLSQSEPIELAGSITLRDTQSGYELEPLLVEGNFGNVTREVLSHSVNQISSPMNLYAGEIYNGEAVTLSFGDGVYLKEAVLEQGETIYLNLDTSFDSEIANRYHSFDIQCYNFRGDEDSFVQPAKLCLPMKWSDTYVYEVVDGELTPVQAQVDEENGQVCFTVESLGYYIVSPILMTE